ncbi:hypothetical protein MPSEU_000582900 [Mayamaea pseudoterrestris]|nr:hypothetical protein MPSEU_000582900 [Mayamaea pseudoterrestris]
MTFPCEAAAAASSTTNAKCTEYSRRMKRQIYQNQSRPLSPLQSMPLSNIHFLSIMVTVTLAASLSLLPTASCFTSHPAIHHSQRKHFASSQLQMSSNKNNPFQFEPSQDLARALGVADPEHPHPPSVPPPDELMMTTTSSHISAATEHNNVEGGGGVPFFVLNQNDVVADSNDHDETSMEHEEHDDEFILDVSSRRDEDDSFASWTVVNLKAECRRRGLPVSGRKALLVERLETSLQQQVTQTVVPSSTSTSTAATNAAWSQILDPWIKARLQRNVQSEAIQGAIVAGTALTAVASKSVAAAGIVGILAAYTAITEGQAGEWTRNVGKVVWDAVMAATEVAKHVKNDVSAAPKQSLLGQSLSLMGDFVNKTISGVESGMVAASLAQEVEHAQESRVEQGQLERKQQEMETAEQQRLKQEQMEQQREMEIAEQQRLKQEQMEQKQQEMEIAEQHRLEQEQLEKKQREMEIAEQQRLEQEQLEKKQRETERAEQQRVMQEQLEEKQRAEDERRSAEMNAAILATRARQTAFMRSMMVQRFAYNSATRTRRQLEAEEASRYESQAKEVARREEAARIAEENDRFELSQMIEERTRMEEQAMAVAAEEASRMVSEAAPEMVDESIISEEDWMESIRVAQKSIEGKMAGYQDVDEELDQEELESWNKAEQLAKQLSQETAEDDLDDFDLDDIDMSTVRASVQNFDTVQTSEPSFDAAAIDSTEWASRTIAELRTECKTRGLLTSGKKADLIARLEQPVADDKSAVDYDDELNDFDLDSIDLSLVGDEARAAVEEYERMRAPGAVNGELATAGVNGDFDALTLAELREECSLRGLSLDGKKADLMARLQSPLVEDELALDDDDNDLDIDLDDFDISSVGDAARAAVEEYERMRVVNGATRTLSTEPLEWDMLSLAQLRDECRDRDLPTNGKKVDLVARLDEFESIGLFPNDVDRLNDSEVSLDLPTIDWSEFSVKELQQELQDRNLPTTGKKAELVAALEAYSLTESYVDETDLDDDLEELALRYGSAAKANAEEDDSDVADDDLELDFDSIDLDAMGQAARQAVDLYSMDQVDEPSDEDLWEIEAMNLPDALIAPASTNIAVAPSLGDPMFYAKMTVTELKDELRERGLAVTGKKTELIERLMMSDVGR